jgi:hypothetical protein
MAEFLSYFVVAMYLKFLCGCSKTRSLKQIFVFVDGQSVLNVCHTVVVFYQIWSMWEKTGHLYDHFKIISLISNSLLIISKSQQN